MKKRDFDTFMEEKFPKYNECIEDNVETETWDTVIKEMLECGSDEYWNETFRDEIPIARCLQQEGGSEYCFTIFQLKGDDKFYKVEYQYSSLGGFDWDYAEVWEVKPIEKVVTIYE